MDPNNTQMLQEILRLSRENNKMLHSLRRNAFLGGVLKIIIYAVLFLAPIWFYATYISGTVDKFVAAVNKAQGTAQSAQTQFSSFEDAMKNIQSHLPSFLQGTTTHTN